MKVTNPDVIKAGERDLIETIKEDLEWDAVKTLLVDRIKETTLETCGGEIIVHEGQIAFKIDLEIKTSISLMFDRDGNHIAAENYDMPRRSNEDPSGARGIENISERSEDYLEKPEDALKEPEDGLEEFEDVKEKSENILEEFEEKALSGDAANLENTDFADISKTNEDDFPDSFDGESLLKEFEEDNFSDASVDNDDDIMQNFDEMLSLSGEESEHNSDEEIEALLKESREFWEKKKK